MDCLLAAAAAAENLVLQRAQLNVPERGVADSLVSRMLTLVAKMDWMEFFQATARLLDSGSKLLGPCHPQPQAWLSAANCCQTMKPLLQANR